MIQLLLFLATHEPREVYYTYRTNEAVVFKIYRRPFGSYVYMTNHFEYPVTERKMYWVEKLKPSSYMLPAIYGERNKF